MFLSFVATGCRVRVGFRALQFADSGAVEYPADRTRTGPGVHKMCHGRVSSSGHGPLGISDNHEGFFMETMPRIWDLL